MCLKRSLSPVGMYLKRSLSPVGMHLKRSLNPVGTCLTRSLSPVGMCLKRSLSPVGMYLKRSLSPVGMYLKRSLSPVGMHLKRSLNPVGTCLKRSLSPVGKRSSLQLVEFDGGMARKLRFHNFFTSSTLGIRREPRTKASFSRIMDAIGMLGFQRNIVFFSGKWSFRCREKLACLRDGFGRRRLNVEMCSRTARAVELFIPGDFFLFCDDAVLLCFACVETLWALELLRWRDAFSSWTLGIWRMPRTTASFSLLQLVEFEGSIARKLRFHNCSHLQLLEFEESLVRQLCFYLFNCWNLKGPSHESFVFSQHWCFVPRSCSCKRNTILFCIWES